MITYLDLNQQEKTDTISYRPVLLFLFCLVFIFFLFSFFPITEEVEYQGIYKEEEIHAILPTTFLLEEKDDLYIKIKEKKYHVLEIERRQIVEGETAYYREVIFKIGKLPLQEGDGLTFFFQKEQTTILDKLINFMKGV